MISAATVNSSSSRAPLLAPCWALIAACLALAASGCVYRIDIQQGNFLENKDIDQINVGMTRSQVRYLLGTPMVADPFQPTRWDYVYYLKKGRLQHVQQRHFIVFFEGDSVARVDRPKEAEITTKVEVKS